MFTVNNKNKNIRQQCHGAILIELMITITLSLLLLTTLLQLYLTSMRSLHIQSALFDMQHQARTTIAILRESIHRAGYIGCAKLTTGFPIQQDAPYSMTAYTKLQSGNQNSITVRYADFSHVTLTENMHDRRYLQATLEHRYKPGDILIISNCQHADIFQVKKILFSHHVQRMLSVHPLHHHYKKESEIARFHIDTFYIEKNKQQLPALFLRDIYHRTTQLVTGIADMQFMFTVNLQNNIKQLAAEQIVDWSKVVGVSLSFFAVSPPFKKVWYAYSST